MHQCLILEEYGPELIYIKGTNNIVANALTRLPIATLDSKMDLNYLADHYGLHDSDLPDDIYPLQYKLIQKCQKTDKSLTNKIK